MEDQAVTAEPEAGEVIDAEFQVVPDEPAMSQLELEHYHEIIRLNKEVKLKQYKYDAAKAEAKFCKEDLDCAAMELSTLIADWLQANAREKEAASNEPEAE